MAIPCTQFIFSDKASLYSEKPGMEKAVLATSSSVPRPVLTQEDLKRIAAYKAVDFVESGMVVGLGTGSTACHAVARIAELLRLGKLQNVVGIPTSKKTEEQALSLGLPLSDLVTHPTVDIAIDGADEVDPCFNLIKGRGGSLYREKMVESRCGRFIVIVDKSKLVKKLGEGGHAIPVEVVPFGWNVTLKKLQFLFKSSGCVAQLRTCSDGKPFLTDNLNYIVNLYFENGIDDLNSASDAVKRIVGVVEHGMFLDMTSTLIVAGTDGVILKNKSDLCLHADA
ncbi:probable ribose-5-phosphate isomerase 2 [Aristolochia californica]|uniref:probable ribose-5-phosphate isomerase 2 n=1 Tax=Aristolochia californica TaxID=171875 RepID=UPI0035E29449